MRFAVGSDHAGFELKRLVVGWLEAWGHAADDLGAYSSESCDYPDIALTVARRVACGDADLGVLICSNGVGPSIVANKVRGVRAALCDNPFASRRAREHTDANVLCLGAWSIGRGLAEEVVRAFASAVFEGGRHTRRVSRIAAIEEELASEGAVPATE